MLNRRNTAAVLFGCVLAICLDLAVGWFFIPEQYNTFRAPHPYYHHCLLPNKNFMDHWGDVEYPFLTNSLGFRDRQVRDVPLAMNRRRIVILGDSFVEGQGVPFEESFSGILQDRLASERIDVLNAGVVSYSPRLYYLKTRYLLENVGFRFSDLLVFIDISDIQNEIVYQHFDPTEISSLRYFAYTAGKVLKRRSYVFYALTKLLQKDGQVMSDFGNMIFDNPFNRFDPREQEIVRHTYDVNYLASWTYDIRTFDLYGLKGMQLAMDNMEALAALCRKYGIRLFVAVYPWPQQVVRHESDSIQVATWMRFCNERGIAFINLFPLFINERSPVDVVREFYIEGDVHWNSAGHARVAQAILPYLQASLRR